ncbi:DNA adenine-methylase, partial [Trabulsiella guamensis ATCC 49490]
MRYGSVCSGIEAASVAWESLGWQPAWFAEIEAFPSAVLVHHWPDVSNLGDMTRIAAAVRAGEVDAPDVLVGGTPCQAFSIAGLREGLSDERGQLTLSYVELANAIDAKRRERGDPESIIVWENVPGVLSSKDNAFGCFLAGLAGESSELQPAGRKWTHAGCVSGPQRAVAWRVLDAQFFGVAQRRRRVFVVASARKDINPAAVLFEFDSVRRDTPPRRETQPETSCATGKCAEGGSHCDNPVNPHPTLNQSHNTGGIGASNQEIFSQRGSGLVSDAYSNISRTLLAKENDSTAEDLDTYVLGYGGGNTSGSIDVATACTAHGVRMDFDTETFAVHVAQDPDVNRELAHTIGRNHGQENAIAWGIPGNWIGRAPENGGNATAPMRNLSPCLTVADKHGVVIAFSSKDYGADANSGSNLAPAIALQTDVTPKASIELAFTLKLPSSSGGGQPAAAMTPDLHVRRLTPIECERLQGFPDNHTLIGWRGKDADECPDGPRYKAIGNSMAVPVMRWIGERIAAALPVEAPAPRNWQRPFLKWAGGKYSLLPELYQLIPAGKRLIEPFVGAGAVFLNSDRHESFLLADVNTDLINLWQMLEADPLRVMDFARNLFESGRTEDGYKSIRANFNAQHMNAPLRAAAFLYLNRHCFNGLMRYNRDGFFNVGFGKYKKPYFPEAEILAFREKSPQCVFMNADFRRTLSLAGDGDVVYCDPPYEPMPGTAGFTSYSAGGFSWDDHQDLARCCVAAYQRGAKVLISNSTAPAVLELYGRHGF